MKLLEYTTSLEAKKQRLAALLRAKASRVKHLPASHEQRRFWLMQQVDPEPFINHVAYGICLAGDLDLEALNTSLTEIIRRHEVLRTNLVMRDGNLLQAVRPAQRIQIPIVDLEALSAGERERLVKQLRHEEFQTVLDLERAGLIRVYIARLGQQRHELAVTLHHIVTDAFEGVLSAELQALYRANATGCPSPLPELEIQYADYAQWQQMCLQKPEVRGQIDYWCEQLAGVPALELARDRRRGKEKSPERGFQFELSWQTSRKIREWSRRESTTLFATLLAAFQWLLGCYSGQEDFAIGTVVSTRREETDNLVGVFMNTVALRARLGGKPSFRQLVGRVQEVFLDALAHQDVPFEKVMEELASRGSQLDAEHAFQTGFVFQNPLEPTIQLHGLQVAGGVALGIPFELKLPIPSMNLLIELQEKVNGGLRGTMLFDSDLFVRESMDRLLRHYKLLLERAVAAPDVPLTDISLLGEEEVSQVVHDWNRTEREYPATKTIHAIFEKQAEQDPEQIAVSAGTSKLTYGELNGKANQMARHLRTLGVGAEVRVGVCLERSPDAVVAIMAVLKAGGAYVPMDPSYPAGRLNFMLEDAAPRVLLTTRKLENKIEAADTTVVCIDDDWETISECNAANLEQVSAPDNLAYIIYTSGSTGVPKGVLVCHQGLCNVVDESIHKFQIVPHCPVAQIASLSFDASVLEIFMTLCAGGRLCIVDSDTLGSSARFAKFLNEEAVCFIGSVPSLLNTLPPNEALPRVKTIVVGGEACTAETASRWSRGRSLFNVYAPTETTIFTTSFKYEQDSPLESPPVGRPIANSRVYILDDGLNPLPVGIGGEIYIGGVGLARGYWRRPELTAERFVPDAFSNKSGGRLYRTGDRGCFQADGNVQFLGRVDDQVKIRGYRIELGEIEARLREQRGVQEAAVVVREEGGEKRVVGYVVGKVGEEVQGMEVRKGMKEWLPEYMVPSVVMVLEEMPLTVNGKVDRGALPVAGIASSEEYVGPETEMEEKMSRIWGEILGREQVGVEENFFEIGGHSLLGTRMMSQVRSGLGVEVPLRALFELPTIRGLAERVEQELKRGGKQKSGEVIAVGRDRDLPLSAAQQRMWFLHQLQPDSTAYNIPLNLQLKGAMDVGILERCVTEIVRRHEVLRTRFVEREGQAEQRIEESREVRLGVVDLSGMELGWRAEMGRHLRQAEAERPFDLGQGPLLRGQVVRLGGEEHELLLSLHHIVGDGWSLEILLRELQALWGAYREGRASPLPELEIQYADFAVWQQGWLQGEVLQQQLAYWRQQLANLPTLDLPRRPLSAAGLDQQGGTVRFSFNKEQSAKLHEYGQRKGVTLFMVLLAGFQWLLSRYSGQEDIAVGTIIANRNRKELEGLIGFFANTLVVRTDVGGELSAEELIKRVREATLAAYTNQDLPFEALVEKLNPERQLGRTPLVQAMFVLENDSDVLLRLPGLVLTGKGTENQNAKFDLTLLLRQGACVEGEFEYRKDLFDESLITRMADNYRVLMDRMMRDPSTPLCSLSVLTEEEQRQTLVNWNRSDEWHGTSASTSADCLPEDCVHELFEAQVRRSPHAVALAHEDSKLSYSDLNTKANRLAHHLDGLGVGPDSRVAICTDRGPEMLIAVMAVLKAGGAYLPLDPAYPAARLRYMLGDSGPQIVLTQKHLLGVFDEIGDIVPVLDLADEAAWQDQPTTNPTRSATGLSREHLAYVIYTSGSTGKPKGVCVGHANLTRFLADIGTALGADGDRGRWLALTNLTFDISILEILWPLTQGFQIVVGDARALMQASQERNSDRRGSIQCPSIQESEDITHLQCTPSLAKLLLADDRGRIHLSKAKKLLLGGEPLSASLIGELRKVTKAAIFNMYGPTETTIWSTVYGLSDEEEEEKEIVSIGKPFGRNQVYVMDDWGQLAPVGAAGELYIGGEQVARGYLNQPRLTAERFVPNPFDHRESSRLYRTGDVVRWRQDGNLEFLRRADHQVKIRGLRIELGEIEARLSEHPGVREAVVMVREDSDNEKRLIAYYTTAEKNGEQANDQAVAVNAGSLRTYLATVLPSPMIPVAYVKLDVVPLTANGKLDRKALPVPPADAYLARGHEDPQGEIETMIAGIWSDLFKLERVGRYDNFFELGGHSLQAVTVIERMRRGNLQVDVRTLFAAPTVAGLAAASTSGSRIEVPENRIPADCAAITPGMLSLVKLSAEEIERVVSAVPGGARNVQDIYPLAPLQEGILFHHLMEGAGDPYVGAQVLTFRTRAKLDSYLESLQAVVDRHDILRTSIMWEGLPEPVQVVWRKALIPVEEVELDPNADEVSKELYARFHPRHFHIDVRQLLLRVFIAEDKQKQCWHMIHLQHQLAGDHTTLELMQEEIQQHLLGRADQLPSPLPFRNLVAQARLGIGPEHEVFFRQLVGDVQEPTAPFGLLDAQDDGTEIQQEQIWLDGALGRSIRERGRALGVSAATLFHLAWAQVLARVSGREDVVFGTVLFGRMQSGASADQMMGLFINTLPVRIQIGDEAVETSVQRTQQLLADLLRHEHASLALAQRCSAVPAPTPLFSVLLNYRHSVNDAIAPPEEVRHAWEGIEISHDEERTNYAVTLSIDDTGEDFALTAQTPATVHPMRICEMMRTSLEALVQALKSKPSVAIRMLDILPESERQQVLYGWNDTRTEYPSNTCVHSLFEEQVHRTPEAVAIVFEGASLSYAELNARANRLAHYLRGVEVNPDARVAICVERSIEMMVGVLGVLKAGGAYVPLDPSYPTERLNYMVQDSGATVLLTQGRLKGVVLSGLRDCPLIVDLDAPAKWKDEPETDPDGASFGLCSTNLAYVIYTSGSTGTPKGVMVEHRSIVNRLVWMQQAFGIDQNDAVLQKTPITFDVSVWELLWPLLYGARLVIAQAEGHKDPAYLVEAVQQNRITVMHFVPSMLQIFLNHSDAGACHSLAHVVCSGEALPAVVARRFQERLPHAKLHNLYGPTEAAVDVSSWTCPPDPIQTVIPIGRPIANTRLYILDGHRRLTPVGVAGELYIAGVQVARGYLNRPDLTAERFINDPFTEEPDARMYRTGDLCRWLADGTIEFLGRNDFQVKIRGFRIELGEIEARLMEYPGMREAAVIACEDASGGKHLVCYYSAAPADQVEMGRQVEADIGAAHLRAHAAATLPEYMVPAAYVRLESLPLSANGKLNRKMLPDPKSDALVAQVYEAPRGSIEITLAAIWCDVLKLERVGRYDNFFELGGHSLLAVTVMERARRKGLRLDVRALFATPTLAEVATAVDCRRHVLDVPANLIRSSNDNSSETIELRI